MSYIFQAVDKHQKSGEPVGIYSLQNKCKPKQTHNLKTRATHKIRDTSLFHISVINKPMPSSVNGVTKIQQWLWPSGVLVPLQDIFNSSIDFCGCDMMIFPLAPTYPETNTKNDNLTKIDIRGGKTINIWYILKRCMKEARKTGQ